MNTFCNVLLLLSFWTFGLYLVSSSVIELLAVIRLEGWLETWRHLPWNVVPLAADWSQIGPTFGVGGTIRTSWERRAAAAAAGHYIDRLFEIRLILFFVLVFDCWSCQMYRSTLPVQLLLLAVSACAGLAAHDNSKFYASMILMIKIIKLTLLSD